MASRSFYSFWSVMVVCALVIATAVYLSVTNGVFDISLLDVVKTLLRINPVPDYDLVIFEFRLPRIVLGLLVGYALGVAGAVVQGVTRNGLADPGILGINAGAGMMVVLFMFLLRGQLDMQGTLSVMAMPMFGLVGGLAAAGLILILARRGGKIDPQRLVLVGIAMSLGFGAATLYFSLKMNPQDFEMAVVWLSGSIYSANWRFVLAVLPWIILIPPLLWTRASKLDLLQLEDTSAISVGLAVERERLLLLIGSVALVAASVSVSGSIGFVGLIAPHMARRLVGLSHRYILPVSGVVGMAMVVVGDLIGKTVFAPAQLAVGIVISVIGVPYFVYLLIRARA
ncbi:bacillibactin ABC transporter integral membrane protein [Paenibacillus cellulosilyticus]|uniref:Bacillibactin ABC transporter integral membrane protein n=1 Tax=Paenibacillus cellulosilyticus TaxID=375489 RepID=A0A2V2YNK4_9BACL|nr:bacillibactin ABC transporter integral membrane protein [Paenibacillus cellulosilyticus]